ncbi:hypothetical protein [Oceanimonas sp. CAM02]|uniref:hypothetical protein n=1 Tax=Oceanimonas sp. CAM02 TaxID=3080336 RepID=UPI002935AE9E|nr:hypothetical protein [Oceanimonas sp. CAM02]MDV2857273.1 hypothetical protein [Oceanimonas sp. CAM02]
MNVTLEKSGTVKYVLKILRHRSRTCFLVKPALFVALSLAQPCLTFADTHLNSSILESNSLNSIKGSLGLNMAAGDNNIQVNLKSISADDHASSSIRSYTHNRTLTESSSGALVEIHKNSLNNSHGLISVNQVAGGGNSQLNSMAIAFGKNAIVSNELLIGINTHSESSTPAESDNSIKNVRLSQNSLKGSSGAIQLNQIAGNGNVAVNRISAPVR